jgi:hypothetical protein
MDLILSEIIGVRIFKFSSSRLSLSFMNSIQDLAALLWFKKIQDGGDKEILFVDKYHMMTIVE